MSKLLLAGAPRRGHRYGARGCYGQGMAGSKPQFGEVAVSRFEVDVEHRAVHVRLYGADLDTADLVQYALVELLKGLHLPMASEDEPGWSVSMHAID
jgi:hypothetical protein